MKLCPTATATCPNRRLNERGMTMMEVMVSILILTIALLGLLSMGMVALDGNRWSHNSTKSTQLVQEKMEGLRTSKDPESGHETVGDITLTWEVSTVGSHLKRIAVSAAWENDREITERNSMTSYLMTDGI